MKRAVMITGLAAVGASLAACQSMNDARSRLVRTPPACEDVTVPVYFEPNQAQLPPDGQRVIAAAARQARPCRVEGVHVVGLADAAGDPAANLELSRRRAAAVTSAIMRAGLPDASFDLDAAGQAGSVTADGRVVPVRRRADITLRLAKPK
jgi:peptidoglycan-associated lipoprotein